MLESGCLGYPVHCGHCGAIFSSGFDLSQHLNVGGGLTRSVPFPAYTTISLSSFVSLNSVFPAAVSFCPSNISSVSSANPASSIPAAAVDGCVATWSLFWVVSCLADWWSNWSLWSDRSWASSRSSLLALLTVHYTRLRKLCEGSQPRRGLSRWFSGGGVLWTVGAVFCGCLECRRCSLVLSSRLVFSAWLSKADSVQSKVIYFCWVPRKWFFPTILVIRVQAKF